jgi:hypothetical protein
VTRYWVIRTDKAKTEYVAGELAHGRLRQGWGWTGEQDLRAIAADSQAGKSLNDAQKSTWRGNRRLLDSEPDGVRMGDLVLLPHQPSHGSWSLVRVSGPYRWEHATELNSYDMPDYGHILPIEMVSTRPIHPFEDAVSARLRQTMRNMSRMWNIDALGPDVDELAEACSHGAVAPPPAVDRLPKVLSAVEVATWEALQKQFHGAEFERPCVLLLEALYGDGNVEHTGGSGERGADAIVTHDDPLGVTHRLAVQVKMWSWDADWTRPLEQIRQASGAYEGITGGVILSTSERVSERFEEHRRKLEAELRIPIRVVLRQELVRLFVAHLPEIGVAE